MMHQFNQTMDYLEQQLTGEVDMKRFQQLSGYSYPLFSRIFSIMADMTLAEYLRNRRLSEAVTDLREGSEKVDVYKRQVLALTINGIWAG